MRRTIAIISAVALAFALQLSADDAKKEPSKGETASASESAPSAPDESPLVKAARAGKANREGEKSRLSITNADVKKSQGKIIQAGTKPLDPLPAVSDVEKTMRDTAAAKAPKSNRQALQAEVDKHQKAVTDLEQELRRIEETYYNEDDPDYREDVLEKSFEETRKQLEAARKELAAARQALGASGGN